jgi:hypothetical protein
VFSVPIGFVIGALFSSYLIQAKSSLPWVKDSPKGLVTFIGRAELLGGLGLIFLMLWELHRY